MLLVLAVLDGFLALLLLHNALASGGASNNLLLRVLGFGIRLIGLGGVSLYAARRYRLLRFNAALVTYVLLGLNAGLMLFVVRGIFLTQYTLAQPKLYWFDFLKVRDALVLMGFCAVISTTVGMLSYIIKRGQTITMT